MRVSHIQLACKHCNFQSLMFLSTFLVGGIFKTSIRITFWLSDIQSRRRKEFFTLPFWINLCFPVFHVFSWTLLLFFSNWRLSLTTHSNYVKHRKLRWHCRRFQLLSPISFLAMLLKLPFDRPKEFLTTSLVVLYFMLNLRVRFPRSMFGFISQLLKA